MNFKLLEGQKLISRDTVLPEIHKNLENKPFLFLPADLDTSKLTDVTEDGDEFRKFTDPATGTLYDGKDYWDIFMKGMVVKYTPQQVSRRQTIFALNTFNCAKCGFITLAASREVAGFLNLIAQCERAEIRLQSNPDREWCESCCDTNNGFTCYSCREGKKKEDIQYRYGDPPDYLCKNCYNTKTAAEWDALVEEIESNHQYDWE